MAQAAAVIPYVTAAVSAGSAAADAGAATGSKHFAAAVTRQNILTNSQQAGIREEQVRRDARQTLGEQAAAVAESGTGFGGSNRDLMEQDSAKAALDALNARYEGKLNRRNQQNSLNALTAEGGGIMGVFGRKGLAAPINYTSAFGILTKDTDYAW